MALEDSKHRDLHITRSGLEVLHTQINGDIEPAPYNQLLGVRLVDAREGAVELTCQMKPEFLNKIGSGHGGFISSLLDNACGLATDTVSRPGHAFTTMDLHVRMLRPVTLASGVLRVVGEVEKSGRSVAVTTGKLFAEDGTLLASATSSLFVLDV